MAYISKRDGQVKPAGAHREQRATKPKTLTTFQDDDYDDDLDGDDDLQEHEQDRIFKKSLETEFPLSGGETDEDE